jgi:hypothetical protein
VVNNFNRHNEDLKFIFIEENNNQMAYFELNRINKQQTAEMDTHRKQTTI